MLENKLKYIIHVFPKSDFQASVAQPEGLHPFYTSSQELVSFCDIAKYPSDSITMGTGGNACINYSTVPFSTSTDCFNFRCMKNNTKFLYYWIYSKLNVIDDLYFWGMGLRHLQKPLFCNQHIMLPSMNEQQQIVNYLDKKVSIIDKLIANIKQQIDDLIRYKNNVIVEVVTRGLHDNVQTKESDVDIIGRIPCHWVIKRLKYLCAFETGNMDTQDAVDDGIYPFYVRSPIVERSSKYTFCGTAILMAGDGVGAGKVFHYVSGKYAVHQRVYRFSRFKNINSKFLFYFLQNRFSEQMGKGSAQSTVPSIRLPMLQNFLVCVPPENEQEEIVKYIDRQVSKVDFLLDIKQRKIEELTKYKKSLIYECVTGKKEVL